MAEQNETRGFVDAATIAFLARRMPNRRVRAASVRGHTECNCPGAAMTEFVRTIAGPAPSPMSNPHVPSARTTGATCPR